MAYSLVGDLAAVAVELALARAASRPHPASVTHPMDPVGRQEAVVDALPQAVGVDRVAEVGVGVAVVLAQRRGGHAELVGRLEVLQDLAPVAVVAGAAPVALVHDDQVEEVRRILPVQPRPALVLGDGLVDGEVHLPALGRLAVLDLAAGVAERREDLVLGIIDQDVAVGQVEDPGPAVLARAVPPRVPQLPADLEGHDGLAGAGRHGEQHAALALEDGLHGAVDGDLLVVARALAAEVVGRRQQPVRRFRRPAPGPPRSRSHSSSGVGKASRWRSWPVR